MKVILLLLAAIVASPLVQAQADKLTPEEQQAVTTIRDRFNQRLDKEGRLEPLIPEMFIADFGARYAKEKKADPDQGPLILDEGPANPSAGTANDRPNMLNPVQCSNAYHLRKARR